MIRLPDSPIEGAASVSSSRISGAFSRTFATTRALLTTAQAFARDAEPLAAEFVAHAMPATFLDELRAAIALFEQAIHVQGTGRAEHVTATAALDSAFDSGLTAARRLAATL